MFVSTRSAGLTRGSRGLPWYTRWRRCLVLHRNHLQQMTRHHHCYRMSWIIRLLPPVSCLFVSEYLPPDGVPESELVHCSVHRQARSDRAHPLTSLPETEEIDDRVDHSHRPSWGWQWNVSILHSGHVIRYYPNQRQHNLSIIALTWMVVGYVTVTLRIHARFKKKNLKYPSIQPIRYWFTILIIFVVSWGDLTLKAISKYPK